MTTATKDKRRTFKYYTQSEDEYILSQVGKVPARDIGKELGRSGDCILNRICRLRKRELFPKDIKYQAPLHLRRRRETDNFHYFTEKEDKLILREYGNLPLREMARTLGRVNGSIESRIRILRKQGKLNGRTPYGHKMFRPWSEQDNRYLKGHYGLKPTIDIAKELNREVSAVERQASALGVKFRGSNYTTSDVAEMFGVTNQRVLKWVNDGLLKCFDSGVKGIHYYRYTYANLKAFVENWAGFYEPEKIKHTILKHLASKIAETKKYLTTSQAADYLGISATRLRTHIYNGNLQGILIFGRKRKSGWRIKETHLIEFINSSNLQKVKPTTVIIAGERLTVYPAKCQRGMRCSQCFFEGKLQCNYSDVRPKAPAVIRHKPHNSLTVAEYAEKVGYSPSGIYRLTNVGQLDFIKKGKLKFIPKDAHIDKECLICSKPIGKYRILYYLSCADNMRSKRRARYNKNRVKAA